MPPPPPRAGSREPPDVLDARHLGPEAVRRYVRRHGLTPVRRFSQSFLADGGVLEAIVGLAEINPGRTVLEVGPGPGILTGALLAAGARVVAVEVDPRMTAHLADRFGYAGDGLRIVEGDALDLAVSELVQPPFDAVANLPYHITSPILHHLLGAEPRPVRFTFMLQREVAERIAAAPGAMSYLSVFVQYHARVRVGLVVPARAFEPEPAVDSAVLAGETRPRLLEPVAEEGLWRLVQAAFRERRKMLANVLPRQLPELGREQLAAALEATGIDPRRRPQTLSVEEWLALAAALGPLDGPGWAGDGG